MPHGESSTTAGHEPPVQLPVGAEHVDEAVVQTGRVVVVTGHVQRVRDVDLVADRRRCRTASSAVGRFGSTNAPAQCCSVNDESYTSTALWPNAVAYRYGAPFDSAIARPL